MACFSDELVINNIDVFKSLIHPEDLLAVLQEFDRSAKTMNNLYIEFRFFLLGDTRWIQMLSHPNLHNSSIVWKGIMLDITHRKEANRELENEKIRRYHDKLEQLIRERTEELNAANEELCTVNEELITLNEQLNEKNIELIEEIKARKKAIKKLEEKEKQVAKFLAPPGAVQIVA